MKKFIMLTLLAGLLQLPGITSALAISIGFQPGSQTVNLGSPATVDIVVSNLVGGEIVSAFDLDINYNSSILNPTSVVFGGQLGDPLLLEALTSFNLSTLGVIDLAEVSLLTDPQIATLQGGGSVILASLFFNSIGVGTSDLTFTFDLFNNVTGLNANLLTLTENPGSITVVSSSVPEPGTYLLLAPGFIFLAFAYHRQKLAQKS